MFIHPGGEQKVSPTVGRKKIPSHLHGWYRCPWTTGGHGRKFLETAGEYVSISDMTKHQTGSLQLWCEAEWDTIYRDLGPSPAATRTKIYPRHLHKFFLSAGELTPGTVNSDPFVFGKQFIYSNCRQNQLKKNNLGAGDIVLFGSIKEKHENEPRCFLLDTVFVLSDQIFQMDSGISIQKIRLECGDKISDLFEKAVLQPLLKSGSCSSAKNQPNDFTLYFGASYDCQYKGMYSFVPIQVPGLTKQSGSDCGYPRLIIDPGTLPRELNPVIHFGINPQSGIFCTGVPDSKKIWESLTQYAAQKGYAQGTLFHEP